MSNESNYMHVVTLNKPRLQLLLNNGQVIHVTQDGRKYEIRPELDCCPEWKSWSKSHPKFARQFKNCPYCGAEISGNGSEPVYKKNALKGRHWITHPDGTRTWSKKVTDENVHGHTV